LETFAKSKEKLVSWIETCNHYYQNESLRAESETIGTADVNASAKLFQWFCFSNKVSVFFKPRQAMRFHNHSFFWFLPHNKVLAVATELPVDLHI